MYSLVMACGFILIGEIGFSQVLVNNGDNITNLGTEIYVNGGILNATNGTYINNGSIYFTEDWTNNGGNAAFTAASNGTVLMVGGDQTIQGSSITGFYNLTLLGSGIKQLSGIDAIIKNNLNLNDREFSTDINTAFVTNTAADAITRASGFVSSLGNGALSRNTASSSDYLFPVGSSAGTPRYRPVEITPVNSSSNAYTVRMANTDPTSENFNTSLRETTISSINELFYHRIRRDSGSAAADITLYYDESLDGEFSSIAHWQSQPRWEDIKANPSANNFGLNAMKKQAWNDFSYPAFALITRECAAIYLPNAFSPNGDNENDVLKIYGSECIEKLKLFIYDRWGKIVFHTNDPLFFWDGAYPEGIIPYKDKPMNTAVFFYYLKATLFSGETIVKEGNISLIQ